MTYPSIKTVKKDYLQLVQSIADLARQCDGNFQVLRDLNVSLVNASAPSQMSILDGTQTYARQEFAASRKLST